MYSGTSQKKTSHNKMGYSIRHGMIIFIEAGTRGTYWKRGVTRDAEIDFASSPGTQWPDMVAVGFLTTRRVWRATV